MAEVHRIIGSLHQQRTALHLDTTDLCFLVALRARGEVGGLDAYSEDLLYEEFQQVCELAEPDAQNPRKRATHAVQRLREQRLLARVDGAGLVRAGEFSLTPLADAIVRFFLEDESLTRASLAALTGALRSHLNAVLSAARAAGSAEEWQAEVVTPLRHSVRDLVSGIERRQRGMDAQQEEVRARIGALLQRDWFQAVEACEALLEETSMTLRELNEVLLRDCGNLHGQLHELELMAGATGMVEAIAATLQLQDQVDRVSAWGGARQRAWSDYYQFVQRYLRDVVRLDPERALSQRLRDQISELCERPYGLYVADNQGIRVPREDDEAPVSRPPVQEPRADRDRILDELPPDFRPTQIEDRVRAALDAGAPTLSAVLIKVLPTVSVGDRFLWTGRVTELVGRSARKLRSDIETPWTEVLDGLSVQEWLILKGEDR